MSGAGWITLGFSILLPLIVVAGFLLGLKRGLKRSAIRLGYVAICLALAGVTAYLLAGVVTGISFSFLGGRNLTEFFAEIIRDTLGNSQKFNPTAEMLALCVRLVVSSVLFVVVFLIYMLITYIIFARTTKRKPYIDSKGEQIKYKDKKGNEKFTLEIIKHRWWGGLIGLIQGFLVAFCIAVPFSGIGNIVYKINSTASANTGNQSTNIIEEFVPQSITDYLGAYNKNAFNVVFGWMNVDQAMFNLLTTTNVDGYKLSVTDEILTINEVYETTSENGILINNFRYSIYNLPNSKFYNYVSTVIDQAFNSTFAKQLVVDYSNYLASNAGVEQNAKISDSEWHRDNIRIKTVANDNASLLKDLIAGIAVDFENIELASLGKLLNTGRELSFVGSEMFNTYVDKLFNKFGIYDYATENDLSLGTLHFDTCNFEKLLGTIDGAVKLAKKLEVMGSVGNKDTITAEDLDILATLGDEDFDETVKAELDTKIKDYIDSNADLDVNLKEETDLIESAVILSEFLNNQGGDIASAESVVQAIEADEELLKLLGYNNNAFMISEQQYQALEEASQGKTFALELLNMFVTNSVDIIYYDSLTNKVLYMTSYKVGDLVNLYIPESPCFRYRVDEITGEVIKLDDYKFMGWYLDGVKVTEPFKATKSLTLTVRWYSSWTEFY